MRTGCVDVRTRDTERHGKMRVDQVADMLEALKPAPSDSFGRFYNKVWNVDDYKDMPLPEPKKIEESEEKKEFVEKAKKEQPAKGGKKEKQEK